MRATRTLDEALAGWENGSFTVFGPEDVHALVAAARKWHALTKQEPEEAYVLEGFPRVDAPYLGRFILVPVDEEATT